jgi:hypothetical protein
MQTYVRVGLDVERAFEHDGGMARTRVRRRRLALGVLILGLTGVLVGPVGHGLVAATPRHVPHVRYVVRPGDTLWSIALDRGPAGADPRAVVQAIERENGVGPSTLLPGRLLLIPRSA